MAGVIPYTHGSWKKTNADRIREMSDEELAEWASAITLEEFGDKKDWLDWLKEEVSNG
jgi:hypothetical protein